MENDCFVDDSIIEDIFLAKERSKLESNLKGFKGFHRDQSLRASYFVEMKDVISKLGLQNPHEISALTIEPTHPVLSKHLKNTINKLRINPILGENFKDLKLSLVSLDMLQQLSSNSEASILKFKGYKSPFYLLDPLYGFVFLNEKNGRIKNHCLAINLWFSQLKRMPASVANKLWSDRANSYLSAGAIAGRALFKRIIEPEFDPLKKFLLLFYMLIRKLN